MSDLTYDDLTLLYCCSASLGCLSLNLRKRGEEQWADDLKDEAERLRSLYIRLREQPIKDSPND